MGEVGLEFRLTADPRLEKLLQDPVMQARLHELLGEAIENMEDEAYGMQQRVGIGPGLKFLHGKGTEGTEETEKGRGGTQGDVGG